MGSFCSCSLFEIPVSVSLISLHSLEFGLFFLDLFFFFFLFPLHLVPLHFFLLYCLACFLFSFSFLCNSKGVNTYTYPYPYLHTNLNKKIKAGTGVAEDSKKMALCVGISHRICIVRIYSIHHTYPIPFHPPIFGYEKNCALYNIIISGNLPR